MRPTVSFLLAHPAHLVALGFGTGLSPVGPGTAGSLLAVALHLALLQRMTPLLILALCVPLFLLGIWACARTGRDLGAPDHGAMNWDEVVALLAALSFVPATPLWIGAAFVLFRIFDILKPPPIRQLDANLKSGFGVMIDDIIAAFYTLFVLAAGRALWS